MNNFPKMLIRAGVVLALATAYSSPAYAQFDLLRQLIPSAQMAGKYAAGRKHGEAWTAIMRLASAGDMKQALRLADALVADEQADLPGSPWLGQSAAQAASLYERSGNVSRAIELYQLVLANSAPGQGMPFTQTGITAGLKIADLQLQVGNAEAARQGYLALLSAPGSTSALMGPLRARMYAGLGRAALRLGDDAQAEGMLLQAISEDEVLARQAHGSGLAGFAAIMGGAKGRVEEVLASMEAQRTISDTNGTLVTGMSGGQVRRTGVLEVDEPLLDLASLYFRQRNAAALQRLYLGMFSDHAARMGSMETPLGAPAQLEKEYARFGAYLAGLRQNAMAAQAFGQALRLNARRLKASAADVAPELLAGSFATRRQILDLLLSLRLAERAEPAQWRATLGDLLQSKGLQSDFLARRTRVIGLSRDPAVTGLVAQMRAIDDAGTGTVEQYARRSNLAMALQQKVSGLLPPLQFEDGAHFLDVVQARLGTETLVSLSRFALFDFDRQQFGAAHYLGAKIMHDGVQVLDLGSAEALDALGARLRVDLARRPAAGTAQPVLASARAGYDALLKPLLGARAAKGTYVAELDGALALLPFEALADGGGYLVEDGEWRYVSSARALLRADTPAGGAGQAVILADPDYGPMDATGAGATPSKDLALRGMRLAPLPEALEEGKAVAAALRRGGAAVELLTGARASTQALERLHSPRYLHIATHGFFVEEAGIRRQHATGNDGQQFVVENYLAGRSSGLALAGANNTLANGTGDGVMYASRVSQLDLAGTELAVLSACDTSVGAVLPGEGVDSLRQALAVAGARSMLTSLWPVPDRETRVLMTDFYDGLASGTSKPDALRQAKLRVKQHQGHPFYWASFVLTGQR
jgi:CHAT domain-containing protein/tetratricopeptide (TPR) repeat protein